LSALFAQRHQQCLIELAKVIIFLRPFCSMELCEWIMGVKE
jgi:hypothetical protein